MKLLLTSSGLANNSIISALDDLTQMPFDTLNLAFIPTAANLEKGDKGWLIKDLEICKKLKFKTIDIVDISALPKNIWQKRLEIANILFVEGGTTAHLMYWINKSGLKEILPEFLQSKVYIGVSAGSIVTTPNITVEDKEDKKMIKEAGEIMYEKGLGLVDFLIEPHINSPYFPELTFDFVKQQAEKYSLPVYGLDDNSAVKIKDNDVQVISEGEWKKFNPI